MWPSSRSNAGADRSSPLEGDDRTERRALGAHQYGVVARPDHEKNQKKIRRAWLCCSAHWPLGGARPRGWTARQRGTSGNRASSAVRPTSGFEETNRSGQHRTHGSFPTTVQCDPPGGGSRRRRPGAARVHRTRAPPCCTADGTSRGSNQEPLCNHAASSRSRSPSEPSPSPRRAAKRRPPATTWRSRSTPSPAATRAARTPQWSASSPSRGASACAPARSSCRTSS